MAHNAALPLLEDIATILRLFQVIYDIKENFHNNKLLDHRGRKKWQMSLACY
jgi:hypothetical protein